MCPTGAELFHMDGQTHRQTDRHDEANSRLAHFCDASKNSTSPKRDWLVGMRFIWHKSTASFGMTIVTGISGSST
jgi:hypothetical protein